MESLHTSELQFWTLDGTQLASPSEWLPALIEVPVPVEQWESARLYLQQQELPLRLTRLAGRIRVLGDWPLTNPGHFQLRACWPGGEIVEILTVHPSKISTASFEKLIDDLETRLPASVALAMQRLGAFTGIEILPPDQSTLAQEMVLLRRALYGTESRAGLVAILEDLAHRPHQVLRTNQLWVKTVQARRPHPASLPAAIRRGDNYDKEGCLCSVLDSRVEHAFDVYENQLVKGFVHQVEQRLRRLRRTIGKAAEGHPQASELSAMWIRLLRAKRQATFLEEVTTLRNLQTHTTMVLLNRPSYRSAFQGYLEFNKAVATRFDEPRLDAPLANLPELYQLWCTMMVIECLLVTGDLLGYRVTSQHLVHKDSDGLRLRIIPDNRPAVELLHSGSGQAVRLIPERTYGRSGELRSISFQQRPDIAIEVIPRLEPTRLYLFDPKYKLRSEQSSGPLDADDAPLPLGMPKKVDIDKMHSYRDAIRDRELRRAVKYAAILYPGSEVLYTDGVEALHADPHSVDVLQQRLQAVLAQAMHL